MNRIDYSITLIVGSDSDVIVSENKKHINRFIKSKKLDGNDYKVLIIDFENKYKGVKLKTEDISIFKNKICVIGNPKMTNAERIDLLKQVGYKYKGGLLIIDDFDKIIGDKINDLPLIYAQFSINRTFERDCIFCFGNEFNNIPIKLIQNSDYIRLHDLKDFDKNRIGNFELLEIAKSIIYKGFSYPYNHIILDVTENKIFGLPERDYISGVVNYIYLKLCDVRNSKQLNEFSKMKLKTNYFSELKHIPISNINRIYK